MKTNNFLTWLLYVLLFGLITLAGYKACQIQKEKKQLNAQREAELKPILKDYGYAGADTTGGQGSTYSGDNKTASTTPSTAAKNGIEEEEEPAASTAKTSASATPPPAAKNAAPAATTTAPTLSAKSPTSSPGSSKVAPSAPKKAKFRVQAGSFTRMSGARERLEQVIKLGYPNAEIAHTNGGKFAVVVVMRTNNKQEALRIMDQLEAKGVDATVMENQ
jgi:cell division septation protein DedD